MNGPLFNIGASMGHFKEVVSLLIFQSSLTNRVAK